MKLLRETIRKLILEEVCAGATEKIQQGLDEIERRNLVIGVIKQGSGYNVILNEKEGMGSLLGQFDVTTHPDAPESVFVTAWTEVDPSLENTGVGAVLYDVAIEFASKQSKYLTCDRNTVSKSARRMWAYYNASDDYEVYQMDTSDGYFTPDNPSDDADQRIFYRVARKTLGKYRVGDPTEYRNDFMASPFTKAYRKKRITTIPCLGDRYSVEGGM